MVPGRPQTQTFVRARTAPVPTELNKPSPPRFSSIVAAAGHEDFRSNLLTESAVRWNRGRGQGAGGRKGAGTPGIRRGLQAEQVSSPTVSPGRSRTARTASSTPGMNEVRSSESCRMVSVSPVACRTGPPGGRPGRAGAPSAPGRPSTSAPRAPASSGVVASGTGPARPRRAPRDQPRRAGRGARRRVHLAGVVQLDDLDRRRSTARPVRANRIDSTAPMREVRRDQHARPGFVASQPRRVASRAVVEPGGADDARAMSCVDGRSGCCPCTTSGWVKSTTTSRAGVGQRDQRVARVDAGAPAPCPAPPRPRGTPRRPSGRGRPAQPTRTGRRTQTALTVIRRSLRSSGRVRPARAGRAARPRVVRADDRGGERRPRAAPAPAPPPPRAVTDAIRAEARPRAVRCRP